MKLGTIRLNGEESVIGRVDDANAVALAPATMENLIAAGDRALEDAQKVIDKGLAGEAELIMYPMLTGWRLTLVHRRFWVVRSITTI